MTPFHSTIARDAVFESRRSKTDATIEALRTHMLAAMDPSLAARFETDMTYVATGSAGRGEMGEGSDLDGYVIYLGDDPLGDRYDATLLALTEHALATRGLPPLDRDGSFLKLTTVEDLTSHLGSPRDDVSGALTIRMLFLLESFPLLGEDAYEQLMTRVIAAYRDPLSGHVTNFQPFMLVNDIVRFWRIVLLNHEDRLRQKGLELASADGDVEETLLAHRRYRSQKLRFPRCITCFSTLAYLLAITPNENSEVTVDDERTMFGLPPIRRLERVGELVPAQAERIGAMLDLYARYLERTDEGKAALTARLQADSALAREVSGEGQEFTRLMFELIQELGGGRRLHRQMLV